MKKIIIAVVLITIAFAHTFSEQKEYLSEKSEIVYSKIPPDIIHKVNQKLLKNANGNKQITFFCHLIHDEEGISFKFLNWSASSKDNLTNLISKSNIRINTPAFSVPVVSDDDLLFVNIPFLLQV